MYIFGLTGGIASGKTTVSNYLVKLGCPVIDADVIAREVVCPDEPAWRAIIGQFGVEVLQDDRTLDRKKLGSIIFNDEEQRRVLNRITHPFIQKRMLAQLIKHFLKGETMVVIVSPLLFETNRFLGILKKIITVTCNNEQQLSRLIERDSLTSEEAMKRIASQIPLSEKCRQSDYVIDNTTDRRFTEQQADLLYHNLRRLSKFFGLYKWLTIIAVIYLMYMLISSTFSSS